MVPKEIDWTALGRDAGELTQKVQEILDRHSEELGYEVEIKDLVTCRCFPENGEVTGPEFTIVAQKTKVVS